VTESPSRVGGRRGSREQSLRPLLDKLDADHEAAATAAAAAASGASDTPAAADLD
jgi:hypothetical protein